MGRGGTCPALPAEPSSCYASLRCSGKGGRRPQSSAVIQAPFDPFPSSCYLLCGERIPHFWLEGGAGALRAVQVGGRYILCTELPERARLEVCVGQGTNLSTPQVRGTPLCPSPGRMALAQVCECCWQHVPPELWEMGWFLPDPTWMAPRMSLTSPAGPPTPLLSQLAPAVPGRQAEVFGRVVTRAPLQMCPAGRLTSGCYF